MASSSPCLDEANQSDLTDERIEKWVALRRASSNDPSPKLFIPLTPTYRLV